MGPEAVGDVVGTVVAGLAHGVVLLDVEDVVALAGRLAVLAGPTAGVPAPVHHVGALLVRPEGLALVGLDHRLWGEWDRAFRFFVIFSAEIIGTFLSRACVFFFVGSVLVELCGTLWSCGFMIFCTNGNCNFYALYLKRSRALKTLGNVKDVIVR